MAHERRSDVGPMEKKTPDEALAGRTADPPDARRAHQQLDLGTTLVQQDGTFERALTAADDGDAPTGERREVRVLARVRHQIAREIIELGRAGREPRDARGDRHASRVERLAVLEGHPETVTERLDALDAARVDLGHRTLLEPVAVGDEIAKRHRTGKRGAIAALERIEGERRLRVRDVRRAPGASEQHPLRHLLRPERHRGAEHADVRARRAQVCGRGESIRPGADDDDIGLSATHLCDLPNADWRVSQERMTKSLRVSASMSPVTASALRAPFGHRPRRTSGPGLRSIESRSAVSLQSASPTSTYAPYALGSSESSNGSPSSLRNARTCGGVRCERPTTGIRS